MTGSERLSLGDEPVQRQTLPTIGYAYRYLRSIAKPGCVPPLTFIT